MNNNEIRLMADNEDFVTYNEEEHCGISCDEMEFDSEFGSIYQFGEGDYTNPDWECGMYVSMEDIIDARRNEAASYGGY